jgi:excisionase family DNA binding protein
MIAKLYTVKETADTLRMSRAGVMNLIARGQLPAVRVPGPKPNRPGRVLVSETVLAEYVERWGQ